MPHCSSEHDEQFESMVGGAASLSAAEPVSTIEETISQMIDSEEKTAAEALLQLHTQEDVESCVDFVLETNAKRDDPANLYYYWKDFCRLIRSGFIGVYEANKHVIEPPPPAAAAAAGPRQVIIQGMGGWKLEPNPVLSKGTGGGGAFGDMLNRIIRKYLDGILDDEDETVVNINFFRKNGLRPETDDPEESIRLIEPYFECYYLGKIRFTFTIKKTLSNNIINHFSEDILVKAMTRYVTSFFKVYEQEISFLCLGKILNMISDTQYDSRIRIGLALFLLHLLKSYKIQISDRAQEFLGKTSESVRATTEYLETNVYYYGDQIFKKKVATARFVETRANKMSENRDEVYTVAKDVVDNLIPEETGPVKKAAMTCIKDLMEQETFNDMKSAANTIRSELFLDPHRRKSPRKKGAANGGAPKRITKKHTKKGKSKMLKGKSKKHLKKAKKGKKTGKKVRFHSASKKSKKNTRKRR